VFVVNKYSKYEHVSKWHDSILMNSLQNEGHARVVRWGWNESASALAMCLQICEVSTRVLFNFLLFMPLIVRSFE
jgi:hypothetical protein